MESGNYKEYYRKHPEFGARMNELRSKQTLADNRSVEAHKRIAPFMAGKISFDDLIQVISDFQASAKLDTDECWVAALLRSGINPEEITRLWDAKDEFSREVKERIADTP